MNKSSVFSLELKNGNFTFKEIPEFCYVDTSFINEIYGKSSDLHTRNLCTNFMNEVIKNNGYFLTSGLVLEELYHVIRGRYIKDIIKDDTVRQGKIEKYLEQNPQTNEQIIEEIKQVREKVKSICMFLPYKHDEDLDEMILNVMKLYNLNSRDAKHVVIGLTNSTNSIATVDGGFKTTDNLNIYTPTKSLIISSNDGRANTYIPYKQSFVDIIRPKIVSNVTNVKTEVS